MQSFIHAWRGIQHVFKHEKHFRIDVVVGVLVLFLGWYLEVSSTEFVILVAMVSMVLVLEMINSAVEYMIDLVKPRLSAQVKIIKDVSAGLVLIGAIGAAIIGILILGPELIALIGDLVIE